MEQTVFFLSLKFSTLLAFIDPSITCCAHVLRLQTTPVCDLKCKLVGFMLSWYSTVPEADTASV